MVFLIISLQQGGDNFKQKKDEQSTNAQARVHHLAVPLQVQNVLQSQQRITLKQWSFKMRTQFI